MQTNDLLLQPPAGHTNMSDIHNIINPPDEYEYQYNYSGPSEVPAAAESNDNGSKVSQEAILDLFEKIKTHFPAARIKKIMQSDEDIGKVAQATPVVVGRALEIFMANLVEASIIEARKHGVRRIGALHIRSAVENTEQFDFLVDAVEKYPQAK